MPVDVDVPVAYRPAEAARVLGVSRARIYELLSSGELRAKKLGGSTLIARSELIAFLAKLPRYRPGDAA